MFLQSDEYISVCYISVSSHFSWLLSWHKLLYWSQTSYASCGSVYVNISTNASFERTGGKVHQLLPLAHATSKI